MIIPSGYLNNENNVKENTAAVTLVDLCNNRILTLDECWSIHNKPEYLFRKIRFVIPSKFKKDRMF